MHKITALKNLAVLSSLAVALSACAYGSEPRLNDGAIIGGASGAVIGGVATRSAGGAIVGGLAGAVIGSAIDDSSRHHRNRNCYYSTRYERQVCRYR